jgi:hypothetical protein
LKKLTAKQEQFILKIVEGVSQTEAYKMIYDTSKMKDKTISKRAYDLFNKPVIQNRYEELMNELKESSKWTVERAVDDLIWLKDEAQRNIEENGLKQANSNAYLSSIKELNTLLSLYPKKVVEEDSKEDKLDKIFEGLEAVFTNGNR